MPYLMKKGFLYDLEDSFDILMDYRIIFIGEEHESRVSHQAELTILKGLAERDSNLVLALEMFERDVQDVLGAYLIGKISEKNFLSRLALGQTTWRITGPLLSLRRRRESQ